MKRMLLIAGVIAALGSVGLYSSLGRTPVPEPPKSTSEAARARIVRGLGYVEPVSEMRRLVFQVEGVIETVPVQIGQRVEAGAVLMTLYNATEKAALVEAEQQLRLAVAKHDQLFAGVHPDQILAAKKKIDVLKERLAYAEKHHKRAAALAANKAGAVADLDQADSELRQAQQSLSQAEAELANLENHVRPSDREVADAEVKLAEAKVASAKQQLERTILKAPFDGAVLEILRREGEGARQTDHEPVLIFADDAQLRLRAEIDERYAHRLADGQTAEIYGRAIGDQRVPGRVAVVKRLMGDKTVFSRDASERKDLDVIQALIDLPREFKAPLGLKLDVDVIVDGSTKD